VEVRHDVGDLEDPRVWALAKAAVEAAGLEGRKAFRWTLITILSVHDTKETYQSYLDVVVNTLAQHGSKPEVHA
jgi:hypothetical protein